MRYAFIGLGNLGGTDPIPTLKTVPKDKIDREAWEALYSDVLQPFPLQSIGCIAVKVMDYLGEGVFRVFEARRGRRWSRLD